MISHFRFSEIIKNGVQNRGNVLQLPDGAWNHTLDYFTGGDFVDCFHSAFMHSVDYYNHRDTDGGKSGYNGDVFSKVLFWDFDGDLVQVKSEAVELVERLMAYNPSNISIYFSGNKGFHVFYYSPELVEFMSPTFNQTVKNVCSTIASGLISFDRKIYDKTRIIRTPNSIHSSTGLYKIPLTYEELKNISIEELTELAKTKRKFTYNYDESPDGDLIELIKHSVTENHTGNKAGGVIKVNDLLEGIRYGFQDGGRNSGLASAAGLLHSRGFDNSVVESFVMAVNGNSASPLPDMEVERICRSISRYSVDREFVEPTCDAIVTIKQAGESWCERMRKSGFFSIDPRFDHINERMKTCIPGDVVGVVADSSVGKTSIGMEFGNNEAMCRSLQGEEHYSLFASLEMSKEGVFFRASTIEATHLVDQTMRVPSTEVADELLRCEELKNKVYRQWKNLLILDKGGLSLEKIAEFYHLAQEAYDGKITNLVIDYAQNMDKAENVEHAQRMAREIKTTAKDLKTILFILFQCNKTIPDSYTEIQPHHLEGVGAWRQSCDYLIGFWKSRDNKNRLHGKFIKDRWGESDYHVDLVRDGLKYKSEIYLPERDWYGL